jgi:antitoxin (DNA-binding transcriptional repressor) of toxin-antitoxin stability system
MKQIDLDDLPPRVSQVLSRLTPGETLTVVHNGAVIAQLTVAEASSRTEPLADLPAEERIAEIMDHFKTIIDDEF